MSRKTPILLRRGPLSGNVYAVLRYTYEIGAGKWLILKAGEKQDVTADFDALMLEELFGRDDDSPNIVAILERVADREVLTVEERAEVRAFRERLAAACERHNKRQVTA